MALASRYVSADTLRRGLERAVPLAPEYEDQMIDAAAARTLLRCQDDALEALSADGLLTVPSPTGPRFRRCDILNVGLYCGSGRTIAEVAESHRVRWTAEPRERWLEPRTWTVGLELRCARCTGGEWQIPPPVPERFGGTVHEWAQGSGGGVPAAVEGRVTVHGKEGTLDSPAVLRIFRDVVDDLVSERVRYQYLPAGLRRDPGAAARAGALDCMAASLLVESRCGDDGIVARTRKGLLLGSAAVEHVWVEVRNGDTWTPLDPVLPALAARGAGAGPEFAEFAGGSVSNRLLPWDLGADDDLVRHVCPAGPLGPADVAMNASARAEL